MRISSFRTDGRADGSAAQQSHIIDQAASSVSAGREGRFPLVTFNMTRGSDSSWNGACPVKTWNV